MEERDIWGLVFFVVYAAYHVFVLFQITAVKERND